MSVNPGQAAALGFTYPTIRLSPVLLVSLSKPAFMTDKRINRINRPPAKKGQQ